MIPSLKGGFLKGAQSVDHQCGNDAAGIFTQFVGRIVTREPIFGGAADILVVLRVPALIVIRDHRSYDCSNPL
jgi:hypothetical protein